MTHPIILIDGGMGQELQKRSNEKPSPLWSARVMMDTPETVESVHVDFINAGARVITLNAYSATLERLERDATADLFDTLQAQAIEIAKRARDKANADFDVKIAGCLPPLSGSYHPESAPPEAQSIATYEKIVAAQAAHVDLFMCETMSSVPEATYASQAAAATGKPVWCALSLQDDDRNLLRSKEPLKTALEALKTLDLQAVLLNCSRPEAISAAMPQMVQNTSLTGAYANGFTNAAELQVGTSVASMGVRSDLGPEAYADVAAGWVRDGARIVGGCCEVGPEHIRVLHDRLVEDGYEIVSRV